MQIEQTGFGFERGVAGWALLAAIALVLGACAHKAPPPAAAAPQAAPPVEQTVAAPPPVVEQPALDRLKQMSDTLAAAKSLTYHSHSTVEMPAKTGQFLTRFIEADYALQRPNKLRANISGDLSAFQFYYDGAHVSALDPAKNLYATADAPGTIDEMLPFIIEKADIEFPSADLLASNPYAEMTKGLTHAIVVGPAHVNGVPCEHFAFMGPESNWEIWIETGANPLPRRIAVTYKTVENFPRFLVEFPRWNLAPKLNASQFVFNKPAGATLIEFSSAIAKPPAQ